MIRREKLQKKHPQQKSQNLQQTEQIPSENASKNDIRNFENELGHRRLYSPAVIRVSLKSPIETNPGQDPPRRLHEPRHLKLKPANGNDPAAVREWESPIERHSGGNRKKENEHRRKTQYGIVETEASPMLFDSTTMPFLNEAGNGG